LTVASATSKENPAATRNRALPNLIHANVGAQKLLPQVVYFENGFDFRQGGQGGCGQ
jgi:hypothetical protein